MMLERLLTFAGPSAVLLIALWAAVKWFVKRAVETKFKAHEAKLNSLIEINKGLLEQKFKAYENLVGAVSSASTSVRNFYRPNSTTQNINRLLNKLVDELESTMASGRFHMDDKVYDKAHGFKLLFQGLVAEVNSELKSSDELKTLFEESNEKIERLQKELQSMIHTEREKLMGTLL